jgi:phospholipid transport system transporter-binding protein
MTRTHRIVNDLNQSGAKAALEEGRGHIAADGELVLDLGGVESADSAGICVLLDWTRTAQANGCRLRLINIPPRLRAFAQLYGLSDLLPMEERRRVS